LNRKGAKAQSFRILHACLRVAASSCANASEDRSAKAGINAEAQSLMHYHLKQDNYDWPQMAQMGTDRLIEMFLSWKWITSDADVRRERGSDAASV
jgi:hypothetical protein